MPTIDLSLYPQSKYLETEKEWLWLLEELKTACKLGFCTAFDTETLGCDPEEETAVYWARPLIWSIGIADGDMTARGYRRARGFVLPWQALYVFVEWFKGAFGAVYSFNGRFDRHAVANLGIETGGVKDILDYLRVLDPGHEKYSLKDTTPRNLGYEMMGKFLKVFVEERWKVTIRKKKVCTWDESHDYGGGARKKCETCRSLLKTETWEERKQLSDRQVSLAEVCGLTYDLQITPNESSLWPVAVCYAGLDAISTAEQASLIFMGFAFKGSQAQAKIPSV